MSETKRICTRIINKHAPATTWDAADCTFVPEVGELIIYEPAEAGAPARIKIGDGSTYENGEKKVVKDLPFVDHDYSGDISELNKALSDHEKDTTAHITADERAAWNGAKTHAESAHVALNHKHSGADITSGTVSIDRLPTISVAKGGTGATTAADALKNLGLDATATELNYVQGVTSSIQSQLDGKAAASHNHNDKYYTEKEVDNLLAGKSDEHNHPYAPTGHTHVTSDVTALTGYTKASTASEIAATDSLNVALGKLQKTLDTKAASSMTGYSKASSASAITTNDTVLTAIGKLEKALDGKSDTHNHPYSSNTHTHGNIANNGTLATANAVVVTDGNKKVVASTSITTTELGYLDGVTSSVQNQLNAKANKTDIATTVMQGTATQATTYWKIADFGNWGTGNWMQKGFSMLISSRAGEMVWVSLAANDSNTSASAFRLINRYSKIAALHYSVSESAIYVTAAGWSNNICAHVLSNVNGDYVPTIAQATALPSDAVAINITEFGVADANTRVGAVNIDATGNMTVPGTVTVENKVKLDYDSTNECLNFVFV